MSIEAEEEVVEDGELAAIAPLVEIETHVLRHLPPQNRGD